MVPITNVRFADDKGMVANTAKGLQKIMRTGRLNDTAKSYDMKINVNGYDKGYES